MKNLYRYYQGVKDRALYYSLIDPKYFTYSDKAFILKYFFDLKDKSLLKNHSGFLKLLNKKLNNTFDNNIKNFSEQDFLDLIFLYNLAFIPKNIVNNYSEIKTLYNREKNYTKENIKKIINIQYQILNKIIKTHSRLSDEGIIELTSSPYTHPILPLLINSQIAKIPQPDINVPKPYFNFQEDAFNQLIIGRELFNKFFNRYPVGLWPSEGAICADSLRLIKETDFNWIATDEGILENSRKVKIRKDNYLPDPNILYKVYEHNGIKIFFRDRILSDKIGFEYQHLLPKDAIKDFIFYLKQIYLNNTNNEAYHILIALDGENPWDYYSNDGQDFIYSLFLTLSKLPWIKLTTPSEFLKLNVEAINLNDIRPGSWIDSNFNTWIGHNEKNCAWEFLRIAREKIKKMETVNPLIPSLKEAYNNLYSAEGSDWFWWYDKKIDNGREKIFDLLFRRHLSGIYSKLGIDPPPYLDEPISQQ